MCIQGQEKLVSINGEVRSVDLCLADLIQKLNDSGLNTISCCCGHGIRPGVISLRDGRELFIAENFNQARQFDKFFEPLNKQWNL